MTYDYVIVAWENSYDISHGWIIARLVAFIACLMRVYMLGRFLLGVFWISVIPQCWRNLPWYWILSFFFISKLCGGICVCMSTHFLVTPIVLGHPPWFHQDEIASFGNCLLIQCRLHLCRHSGFLLFRFMQTFSF